MKRFWILGLAGAFVAGSALASNLASDNAGNAVYSGGWNNGMNGGYGFGSWAQQVDAGAGYFYVNSYVNNPATIAPGIDTSAVSWGLSASVPPSATAFAMRPFTGGRCPLVRPLRSPCRMATWMAALWASICAMAPA